MRLIPLKQKLCWGLLSVNSHVERLVYMGERPRNIRMWRKEIKRQASSAYWALFFGLPLLGEYLFSELQEGP